MQRLGLELLRMWLCLEGLTDGSLQGAYGVVRLAYNESEDRHYVSLGLGMGVAQVRPHKPGE